MKDISLILKKAVLLLNGYDSKSVSHEIEKIPNIWCRLEDDSNLSWYLISKSDGESVIEYYGYLSAIYPVALLMKECPKDIYKLLSEKGVLFEEYCERYSCEESILRRYVGDINFIDDRFLYDESIPFDEELFLKIDEGIRYINPYNFAFNDINK